MKAITVWQPWASLIAIGAKPYEFRGWLPPKSFIGQRIAIHAAARKVQPREVKELVAQLLFLAPGHMAPALDGDVALPFLERVLLDPSALPLSHVLCTAVLGEPKRGDVIAGEFGAPRDAVEAMRAAGNFNWGWPLTEIECLEPPLPARGAQGFWDWSA